MKNIKDYLSKGTRYIIKAALRRKEQVYIYRTDEITEKGKWRWAIVLVDIPDFWLNSFDTKKKATEYCKKHKLPVGK